MKTRFYLLSVLFAMAALPSTPLYSQETPGDEAVYIIPVKGMIERGLVYVIRRGVDKAIKSGVKTIIFDMDTPGGRVDATEDIIRILIDIPEEITTYTFVNKDALSAGALIALATDNIYMSPGSRIGASAPVSLTGDIKEGDLKEKHVSSLVSLVASAAERKGHRPEIAEAMIRKEMEYKIGDEIISPEGKLLTLSDIEAQKLFTEKEGEEAKTLLSCGTVKNIEELEKKLDLAKKTIVNIRATAAEKVARYIELLSVLFLAGGLLGLYIEFKTPGFGVPGIVGIILLAIFFWGHNVAGLANMGEIILFFIGAALLLVEIFLIPGFGLTGAAGIILILTSLLMSMIPHYHNIPWWAPSGSDIMFATRKLSISFITTFAAACIAAKYLPRTHAFQAVMLSEALAHNRGFEATKNYISLVGSAGTAETPLRPSGIAIFNGQRINVVARGEFIEKDSPIVVAETHGNRIVVEKIDTNPAT